MQQDYTFNLEPGEREFITLGEVEFIFIKAADRPVILTVDGYSQVMEVNQKTRSEKRFSRFELENPDPLLPLTITLVAGLGDYTTQSIKGQLNVVPSIIQADGSVRPDTRSWLDLYINPDQVFTGQQVENGEIIERYQLRTWPDGTDATTRGAGAAFSPSGTVYLVRRVINSGGNMSVELVEMDVNDGSTYRTQVFSGFGSISGREPQDLVYLDDQRLLMVSVNGQVWSLSWAAPGEVSVIGQFAGHSAGGVTPYVGGCALGSNADLTELYYLVRRDSLTYRVEKAPFDSATLQMGSVVQVLESSFSTYYNSINCHWINQVSGQILFHVQAYRGAGEVFKDAVFDLDNLELANFGANLGRFNPGASSNDTNRFYVQQRADGRLEVINEVNNESTWYGTHWEQTLEFSARARVSDNDGAALVNILQPTAPILVTADVAGAYLNNGRFRVSGEIIRYALQCYFNTLDPGDYLDQVYGIDIPETGGRPSWKQILSGNESFKRAGIADDFSVILPGVLRLYVDNNLIRNQ